MTFGPRSVVLGLVAVCSWSACGDGGAPARPDDDAVALDATGDGNSGDALPDGDDDGTDDDADGDSGPDGEGDADAVDAPAPAEYGESCVQDRDCVGAVCLYIAAGLDEGLCSGLCSDSSGCPEDWSCVFIANGGTDAALICVPDDLCIDSDGDRFGLGPGCLGPDCDDSDANRYLGADELCDNVDNDCDGSTDENPVDTDVPCETGYPGVCAAGRTVCDGGLLDCLPNRPASAEVCDGIDNDCDGATDEDAEGAPLVEACYGGAPATRDVGICVAGARACVDGILGACEGQVLPLPESCDGADNDCDGAIDEGSPGSGLVCDTGLQGACATGISACTATGVICVPQRSPVDEVCDGVDNDCDGDIDEDADDEALTRDCYSGPAGTQDVGICVGGTQTCDLGAWSRCEGEVTPQLELCSAFDENCDGQNNEGDPATGIRCETGDFGLCAFGRTTCAETLDDAICVPDYAPAPETCDGFDNDCDDDVDELEDGSPIVRACYDGPTGTAGVGVCVGGEQTCASGSFSGCVGQVLPGVEVCDGADNDCDGVPDDGNPGGGIPCTTGQPGVCNIGVTACVDGAVQCLATTAPGEEICDGLDNDCDGSRDEGPAWSNLGVVCFDGAGQCRAAGTFQCDPADPSGPAVCSAVPLPAGDEVCDGVDNDCDSLVDEEPEWATVGNICFAGEGSCRRPGVLVCDASNPSGPPVCGATPGEMGEEICDGVDNDCDGEIDEDAIWDSVGDVCTSGLGACERTGTFRCNVADRSGPPVCSATPGTATDEVCDGVDNDCDGSTDEDELWANVGDICTAGLGACERAGTFRCDASNPSGPPVCGATPGAAAEEVCDGVDNDCDGATDEDAIWASVGDICTAGLGACERAGTFRCDATNRSGPPVCGATPGRATDEVCDGADNDCDGAIDENEIWANVGNVCSAGVGACERAGTFRCDASNPAGAPVCNATPGASSDEVCDGVDNDCDGATDEDAIWADVGDVCTAGLGACERAGTYRCDAANRSGPPVCGATPGASSDEVCDGVDNDCDGATDEGGAWDAVGTICSAGNGICRRVGIVECDAANRAGPPVCGATPGPSATEVCDGLDNDCDGATDEDIAWSDVGDVCTVGLGVCQRSGVRVCSTADPAGASVCSVTPGTPSGELCDGLDNDCDGSRDEDFAGLGDICFAGQGVCRAAGRIVCDGVDATACDAVPATPPSANETACDYVDDDCDGSVDEDFRTGAVYSGVENCGGCGVDCAGLWAGGPAASHVVPVCDVFLLTAQCGYDCESGWYDLDLDPTNGCEFTPDSGAVYVKTPSAGGVDGVSCGAWDAPCATLTYAINQIANPTSRPRVRAADGAWNENITMRDGVSLLGGHNGINWIRNPSVSVSAINGLNTALHNVAVSFTGVTRATELSGFTITAAPGRSGGGNSVGVAITGRGALVTVRDNRIVASSGGQGTAGTNGTSGVNGVDGTNGGSSSNQLSSCSSSNTINGGAGGSRTCTNPDGGGSTVVNGGAGGTSTCPVWPNQNGSGAAGSGPGAGSGGAGGWNFRGNTSSCTVGDGPVDAQPGTAGGRGTDGTGGTGAASGVGSVSGALWSGAAGGAGTSGGHGGGGGGGGAAAGVQVNNSSTRYVGASGAGGGSGGCAGSRGAGAAAGGGSFAIFVALSPAATSASDLPTLTGNTLTRGSGGTGGSGGNGGAGGEAGAGGLAGTGLDTGTFGFCMLDSALGAAGGRGGHGGGGGGGAGGVSFDLYVAGAGVTSPSYSSANTFTLGSGTATGGAGGAGGLSNNTARNGTAGATGSSGNVSVVP
ncbi:MAG: putative metal-binding motif-containing protein [Myxococcales bacterium]|nr:putative metal-binding motif-containing protein [Myxococcales bacterium]